LAVLVAVAVDCAIALPAIISNPAIASASWLVFPVMLKIPL
jgi:hypothetical protein